MKFYFHSGAKPNLSKIFNWLSLLACWVGFGRTFECGDSLLSPLSQCHNLAPHQEILKWSFLHCWQPPRYVSLDVFHA